MIKDEFPLTLTVLPDEQVPARVMELPLVVYGLLVGLVIVGEVGATVSRIQFTETVAELVPEGLV